ncbi:homeobox protein OTX1-like isoform X2 [Zootermopsis nevadensis]|nr:homeobox protein OTX1-like isoform X2 [Zootermopsis nevadensis]
MGLSMPYPASSGSYMLPDPGFASTSTQISEHHHSTALYSHHHQAAMLQGAMGGPTGEARAPSTSSYTAIGASSYPPQISATSGHHLNQSPPPSSGSSMNYQASHQLPPGPASLTLMGAVAPSTTGDADQAVPPTPDMSPSTAWAPMTSAPSSAQPHQHQHHRNMATPPPTNLMNSNHTSVAAGITSFGHQPGFMPQSRPHHHHHHQPFYSWY